MSAVSLVFLKLTSTTTTRDIAGECKVAGYEGQIDITDWTWNLAWEKKEHRPEFKTMNFGKLMDRASTPMLAAMASGEYLTAVITVEDSSRQGFKLVLTCTNVQLADYDLKGSSKEKDGELDEEWKFSYDTISFAYSLKPTAGAKPGVISVKLDRPPGPMKESSETVDTKLKEAVKGLPLEKIDESWKRVRADLGSAAERSKNKDPNKDGGG